MDYVWGGASYVDILHSECIISTKRVRNEYAIYKKIA